ncbi:MAG: adenylosuccinate lyase [Oscillospiraceae bacterium]|nr:adenylosuccinate lyase [Oscillospiraceae bacterium]
MSHEFYESPLCGRYAGEEMKRVFSDDHKFSTWRKLWLLLAESEQALGLPITDEQLGEMRAHLTDIDYALAARYEREVRHDVMAHVLTFGDCCPKARPIIHLGATSCYVGDNTDILNMRDGLRLIRNLLLGAIAALADFAEKNKALPTLAYTHFQAAQPTTVGKRACLWLNDLLSDLRQLDFQLSELRPLGCRGTTGTAASFLALFDGDASMVTQLEQKIAAGLGFDRCQSVSGQTYSRKTDFAVLQVLSGIAQSASKFAGDVRLLCHLKELDEPFEAGQIGSSAMAYKRNPMRAERMASLSRYVMCDLQNTAVTAASQWLERTLDDSANRRLAIPEAFLATDAVLRLYINIARGLQVYPAVCERHLREELPFMATENILMYCVKNKGGDRQTLHERIRLHAMEASKEVKQYGRENDLLDRILADEAFMLKKEELQALLEPSSFTGMAERQCERFLAEEICPLLKANADVLNIGADIFV